MPAKDRDGIHVSVPKLLKDRLIKEATRRGMFISDLLCEKVEHSYNQEEQERRDLQHALENISQKLDRVLVQLENVVSKPPAPGSKPLYTHRKPPTLEPNDEADTIDEEVRAPLDNDPQRSTPIIKQGLRRWFDR